MKTRDEPFRPSIVRAIPDDAAALTRIALAAKRHWGYPEEWMAAWTDLLTIRPGDIVEHETFLTRVEEQVAGFYSMTVKNGQMHLEHLWVTPERMGQGIGRALFCHAVERARVLGAVALHIESDPNAAVFYERMGARPTSPRVTWLDGQPRELPCFIHELRQ